MYDYLWKCTCGEGNIEATRSRAEWVALTHLYNNLRCKYAAIDEVYRDTKEPTGKYWRTQRG